MGRVTERRFASAKPVLSTAADQQPLNMQSGALWKWDNWVRFVHSWAMLVSSAETRTRATPPGHFVTLALKIQSNGELRSKPRLSTVWSFRGITAKVEFVGVQSLVSVRLALDQVWVTYVRKNHTKYINFLKSDFYMQSRCQDRLNSVPILQKIRKKTAIVLQS